MENQPSLEEVAILTAGNLKNLLLSFIDEIRRLEKENADLRQQLGQ